MKYPNKFIGVLLVLLMAIPVAAGVAMFNDTSNLGVFQTLVCSTGLTCTKVGNTVTMVSGPAISTATITTSGTINSGGNFSVNTNMFTVAAASGNTAVAGTENVVGNFSVNTSNFTVAGASGNTVVAGTLGVTGNLAVATNKFTVAAASGNTLVAGTLTTTGAVTHTGGITVATPGTNFHSWLPPAVASSTSATPSATVVYVSQIYVPFNTTITGLYIANAATCGTNKWIAVLFDHTGAAVANSSLSGILCSGASGYQALVFTAPVAITGQNMYWIGLYANGTTDRYYAVPALGQGWGLAGSVSAQTFGTIASITPPTTFTADVGPVMFTY